MLCSAQALATVDQLASLGSSLPRDAEGNHDSDQLSQQPVRCVDSLMQAAAGSLVAAALLRCLLVEGACAQLGSSVAYRLASSAEVAFKAGMKAAEAVKSLSDARQPHTGSALLPPWASWLAEASRIPFYAVGRAMQLLKQQAGVPMVEALQRTAFAPGKLLAFWCNSVVALAKVEKTSGKPYLFSLQKH